MIVACPGCSTRYRHATAPPAGGAAAHCAKCDATFPLEPARRNYVVLPAGAGLSMPIGMDDPTLADRVGLPGAGAAVMAEAARATTPTTVQGPWLDLVLAIVPSAAGAAVAYHLAGQNQVDPITWTALGGAAGLLLGWGCLLWIRRAD